MKNKSYIGISFIVLIFGIWAVPKIIDRLQNHDVVKTERLNTPAAEKQSGSLFVVGDAPAFKLTNQDEGTITNDFYKGKVYVTEFFFSTCPSICPVMNQNMLEIQEQFENNKNFGIATITINPEFDTPEVLKKHRDMLGITSGNWNFLTGDKKYIYDIANNGYKIYAGDNKMAAGGFEHSGLFALVDKNGKIRCRLDKNNNPIFYYSGLNYTDAQGINEDLDGKYKPGVEAIKEDIKILLQE